MSIPADLAERPFGLPLGQSEEELKIHGPAESLGTYPFGRYHAQQKMFMFDLGGTQRFA